MRGIVSPLSGFGSPFGERKSFNPIRLFQASEQGVWFQPDAANLDWRRNLLERTEEFGNAYYSKTVTVAEDQTASPSGAVTADRITKAAVAFQAVFRTSITSIAAQTYTVSAYFKSDTLTLASIAAISGTNDVRYWFDLSAKTVGGAVGSFATGYVGSTIEDAGNGWLRCSLTFMAQSSQIAVYFYPDKADNTAAGSVFIWGAQLELGSVATDYQRITDVSTELRERFPTVTTFTDTAGTTPAQVGQAVALMLDKSEGLVLGPELWADQIPAVVGFSGAAGSYDDSTRTMSVTTTGVTVAFRFAVPVVEGRRYLLAGKLQGDLSAVTNIRLSASGTLSNAALNTSTGDFIGRVTAQSGFPSINVGLEITLSAATLVSATIDSISVRELAGNHATQSILASRPTLARVPASGRRNLLVRTEEFDNAAWTKAAGTFVTPNAGVAPDGTNTAWKFTEGTTSASYSLLQTVSVTSSTEFTRSFYVKAQEITSVRITSFDGSSQIDAAIDLTTGQQIGGTGVASIEALPNNWFRLSMPRITSPSATTDRAQLILNSTGYVGDGTKGVLLWHPQLELGSTATAYQRVGSTFDVTEAGQPDNFFLSFDGIDDSMSTPSIDFTGTDKMTVFAGVRQVGTDHSLLFDPTGIGNLIALGFRLTTTSFSTPRKAQLVSRGITAISSAFTTTNTSGPLSFIVSGFCQQTSGNSFAQIRFNGLLEGQDFTDQGGGNYGNYSYRIGTRGDLSAGAFFNGQLYSLIARGAQTDLPTIQRTERYVAAKTAGVSIP
jgi:hypothetical protein